MKDAEPMDGDAATIFLRNALLEIPSLLGQLAYIACLRDRDSGRYRHYEMEQMFGEQQSDQALRAVHLENFSDWLCLNLEQQQADLELYFAELATDKRTVLSTWQVLKPYQHLIPAGAEEAERHLFLTDLATSLGLLQKEDPGERPEPEV